VYRSCALVELTENDLAVMSDRIKLKTIIDLRSPAEIAGDGVGALGGAPRHYASVPLLQHVPSASAAPNPAPLVDRYRRFLELGAGGIADVVRILADPSRHPAVFCCTAGKDRTGIVAAILLSVLGVPSDEIIDDYSAGRSQRDWLFSFLSRRKVQSQRITGMEPALLDSAPETMAQFLEILATEYGGARAFLLEVGLDESVFGALEEGLLEDAASPVASPDQEVDVSRRREVGEANNGRRSAIDKNP